MPKVSICLPVYNAQEFLPGCLERILKQSFKDFEVLIVDDRSTDNTTATALAYRKRDRRIVVWQNPEQLGLYASYNECLSRAHGEYIKPLSFNAFLHPDALAKSVATLESRPDYALVTATQKTLGACPGDEIIDPSKFFPSDCIVPGISVIQRCMLGGADLLGGPSAVMFKATAIGDGFNPDLAELAPLDYWVRILKTGNYFHLSEQLIDVWFGESTGFLRSKETLNRAVDLIRLSRLWQGLFQEAGITANEFVDRGLLFLADYTRSLDAAGEIERDLMHLNDDLVQPHVARSAEQLARELADSRKLCLQLLRLATEPRKKVDDRLTEDRVIDSLENRLHEMLSSPSWRATKPLRDAKSMLASGMVTPELKELQELKLAETQDGLMARRAYIKYLRRLIGQIRTSASWKVSAPLRAMNKTR